MSDGIWTSPDTFASFAELASRKQLTEEVASRQSAWDWTGMLGLLPDPDPILRKMGRGDEVLESLTADGHLCSVIQQRKLGTLKKEFRWKPGVAKEGEAPTTEARKLRDDLVADLAGVNLYDLISGILDAPLYGMTPVEIYWRPGDNRLRIKDLQVKPARWFGFDEENNPRFVSIDNPWDGEELPPGKFVFARHFPTYDNPYGLRLLSRCFWPVTFKKGGIKFWVTLAEKYGMPFLIGEYRQGAEKAEQEEMLAKLSQMVRDAVAVIPSGGSVKILETGKGGGKAEIHSGLKTAMDAEMSKVIAGQTLTAEVGEKGSYAAGKVHADVLEDFRQGDEKLVKTAMDAIAGNYGRINRPGVPAPTFNWFEEDEPKTETAERDKTLGETGVRFKKPYYVRVYGLKEDEFDLADPTPKDGEFAAPEAGRFTPAQQAVEGLADAVLPDGAEALAANEEKILAAIQAAGSYDEAMEGLLELYPRLDTDALEEVLARALLAAEMGGRYAAGHEKGGR